MTKYFVFLSFPFFMLLFSLDVYAQSHCFGLFTVYYAHPVSMYGTDQEALDIAYIKSLGFQVINPNLPEHAEGYKREGMEYFTNLIKNKADVVFFRSFPEGKIPAGVAKEIKADPSGISMELTSITGPNDQTIGLIPALGLDGRILTVEETRAVLKELGLR